MSSSGLREAICKGLARQQQSEARRRGVVGVVAGLSEKDQGKSNWTDVDHEETGTPLREGVAQTIAQFETAIAQGKLPQTSN